MVIVEANLEHCFGKACCNLQHLFRSLILITFGAEYSLFCNIQKTLVIPLDPVKKESESVAYLSSFLNLFFRYNQFLSTLFIELPLVHNSTKPKLE